MNARPVRMTRLFSPWPLIAMTACALAACGGGGGSTAAGGPSVLPVQTQVLSSTGTLSAATGTVATGYIECDTQAHTAAGNNCDNYANFTAAAPPAFGGAYTFTAIAATASGQPIAQQLSNGGALSFANGSYRVIEAPSDGTAIVTIAGGPWSMPGSAFSSAAGSFGNTFGVTCTHVGTANLLLQVEANGNVQGLSLATAAFAANTTTVNCSSSGSLTVN
jgi:hypothetical protein